MKLSDRKLGMGCRISRRDVLHGVGAITAASLVPGQALAGAISGTQAAGYPPARNGLRGSHAGSFEVAHSLAREAGRDWGPVEEPDAGIYDLVVAGAGISGLAAAHFYRKTNPDARILILDNHDDFGGHAKRNEFKVGGRTLIGYGGSQTLENPSRYSAVVKTLFRDIGVNFERFETAYDSDFYKRNGLRGGVFFNGDDWGTNRLVSYDLGSLGYMPLAPQKLSTSDAVDQFPISNSARREFLRLLTTTDDMLSEIPAGQKENYLYTISYRDFLSRHMGVSEPEVFAVMQDLAYDSGVGIESSSAGIALLYMALPGFQATGIDPEEDGDPYIHHFPDGNASVARLLVREMIPAVAPGSTMEDVVTASFDYDKLDLESAPVRLRLNSTVVHVANDGDAESAKQVTLDYVRGGQAFRVRARDCVLACYNAIIPSMCPDLPATQREALVRQVKTPIIYTSVALRNWQAWKKLGIGAVVAPGSFYVNAMLDFPVNLGDYRFANEPDDPITVHMERFPHRANQGLSVREQKRLGQYELLAMPFETLERKTRQQLADLLADGGFDPARDIEAITVNRWPHGYADSYDELVEPYYEDPDDERYPHVRGRKTCGRIAIANSDAAARPIIWAAIEQAHRAVTELS